MLKLPPEVRCPKCGNKHCGIICRWCKYNPLKKCRSQLNNTGEVVMQKVYIVVQLPEDGEGYTAIHKSFSSWDAANEYINNEVLPDYLKLMEDRDAREFVKAYYEILEHEVRS